MLATDIPTALLVTGILVLCVTTAITTLALPSITFTWRDRRRSNGGRRFDDRRHPTMGPATYRRVEITPGARGPVPELPPAARQFDGSPDGRPSSDDIAAAEAFIEYLLEHEPRRLAELMNHWISADEDGFSKDSTS